MAYSGHDVDSTAPVAMGNFPVFDTPFSRLTEHWFSFQASSCRDMELDWARCASRVGVQRARTECKEYHEDLMECATRNKHRLRWQEIQKERKKQGDYKPEPPKDSIRMWHLAGELDKVS
eukprot:GHVO01036109.1.p1 GENE.GHVO01036109.1~~GHVO01036109.1.p1  ORF type:complete len:120 (+),score=12.81 GHVO01036109.1:101-460(+)